MKYILMNKNVPIVQLDIEENSGHIERIIELYNVTHIPFGIRIKNSVPDKGDLNKWWKSRSMPASRDGLKDVLALFELSCPEELLTKCMGLSLSDQYWIKPCDKNIQWENVNFFQNDFSKDVGDAFFNSCYFPTDAVNLMSPDNTSDGWLRKKWIMKEQERYLVKAGSNPFNQEPFNEVLASKMMERLNILPYVKYEIYNDNKDKPCSVCKNFITIDTELVSAYQICISIQKQNHVSLYDHFINCSKEFGIVGVKEYLDFTLLCDYVIANTDRHLGNLGFIRDVNSLKFLGPAPVFDNGTSLWHDVVDSKISMLTNQPSRPFKKTHEDQIKLVSSFERFDVKKLKGLDDEFNELLKHNPNIDDTRRSLLCKGLAGRIVLLKNYIEKTVVQNR